MESKMKEQTAVEWLVKEVNSDCLNSTFIRKELIDQAKEMQKEELENELNRFFLYLRNSGEHFIGVPNEQFVKKYLKSR
jgi:hypothetical protein